MKPKIIMIARHRMGIDGRGVSTLVAFWGCPLHCCYCINDFCHDPNVPCEVMDPEELVQKLMIDEIYYRMSGGGIVFGGGEPLLNADYIRQVIVLLPGDIPVRIETSLNVPWECVESLLGVIDEWIIDIKDLNPEIYKTYTQKSNMEVITNYKKLAKAYQSLKEDPKEHIVFRVPLIPNFNTQKDVEKSVSMLNEYGKIDRFKYKIP